MNYLVHHGILGMHWGVRRYQNEDGTLTEAGQKRRQQQLNKWYRRGGHKEMLKKQSEYRSRYRTTSEGKRKNAEWSDAYEEYEKLLNTKSRITSKDEARFIKADNEYTLGERKYVAKKLIAEYGSDKFNTFVNRGKVELGKDFYEKYLEYGAR